MNKYINDFNPSIKRYCHELKQYNTISRESEISLIKKAKNNDIVAKNKLITANLRFVFDVAKNYKGYGASLDDLISEGNMGLMKAIDKFDESKDVKFISYAVWWIRQSIQDFIKKKNIRDSIEKLEYESIRSNNDAYDILPKYDIEDSESFKLKQKKIIEKLLVKLDKRARFIIMSYYGLNDKEMTLEEIGKILKISKERVRKIKEKNLRILKSEILMTHEIGDLLN